MIDLLNFTFQDGWTFSGVTFLAAIVFGTGFRIIARLIRMVLILFKGWPPSHLDADGNWPQVQKVRKEETKKDA